MLVDTEGYACADSVGIQSAEWKVHPALILNVDKPHADTALPYRQIDACARGHDEIVSICVIVGEVEVPLAYEDLCVWGSPMGVIGEFGSDEIS